MKIEKKGIQFTLREEKRLLNYYLKLADKEIQQWIKFEKTCLNKLKKL